MATGTEALSLCKECINSRKSFLLQGGAGSGKTESLKDLLLYIRDTQPYARVVCITHTNAAVSEIQDRVGEVYTISTIHSFLYNQICHYRKNILQVMPELFLLKAIEEDSQDHDAYKKRYEKYNQKHFDLRQGSDGTPVGKREYIKNPTSYNRDLNQKIDTLNQDILGEIKRIVPAYSLYNETQFDRFKEQSFGHDGLLKVFHLLFQRYPLLRKILRDKYDYIFVDEYQDTDADVLRDLLELSVKEGLTVGLFGDHMQSIYEKDLVNLMPYIRGGKLKSIPKKDNYRCSYEVIDHINLLRTDSIKQKVKLKKKSDGILESKTDRRGSARVLYAVTDSKPITHSSQAEKQRHHNQVEQLIAKARKMLGEDAGYKVLILTNKEIAAQNGFARLYKLFDDRYFSPMDQIELCMRKIQALDIAELCHLYKQKRYNELIGCVRKSGYVITRLTHKNKLCQLMERLLYDPDLSIQDAVMLALENHLVGQTEACAKEIERKAQKETDSRYLAFLTHYQAGETSYTKQKQTWDISSKEEFDAFDKIRKREEFYRALFSDDLKFFEVLKYHIYLNEETEYITMHKTKGTSIPSVIVVMEEFFWNEYDFRLLWKPVPGKEKKLEKSQKLIYVACSRARKDLVCVRILTSDEEALFKARFPQAEKIDISGLATEEDQLEET